MSTLRRIEDNDAAPYRESASIGKHLVAVPKAEPVSEAVMQAELAVAADSYDARLLAGGVEARIRVHVARLGNVLLLRGIGRAPVPNFSAQLAVGSDFRTCEIIEFLFERSDATVGSEILVTRLPLAMHHAQSVSIAPIYAERPLIRATTPPLPDEMLSALEYRAGAMRKLAYLEKVLRAHFSVPVTLNSGLIQSIDNWFRGVTEGRFATRQPAVTVNFSTFPNTFDGPPFSEPGLVRVSEFPGNETFLGATVDIGVYSFVAWHSVVSNRRHLARLRENPLAYVRFAILDHQIEWVFEKFEKLPAHNRARALKAFEHDLQKEEPSAVARLLREPLIGRCTPDEALEIAEGVGTWLQLPDRIIPQPPVYDEKTDSYRIDLALVYPRSGHASVGVIRIAAKTGVVLEVPSRDEIMESASVAADTLLHA